jgi:hemolysin III
VSVAETQVEVAGAPFLTLVPAEGPGLARVAPVELFAKPRLRGVFHQVAFFAALPAAALLIHAARTGRAELAAGVYGVGLCALFGVSSAYHRLPWRPAARRRMRRADHGTIFVMIAATYTPLCLLVLHGAVATGLLVGAWAGALTGVTLVATRVVERPGWEGLEAGLYMLLGWMALIAVPQLARSTSAIDLSLLLAGGLMYTVGVTILGRRRPDPSPLVFGYHEVWHTLVVAASICHFLMILSFVRAA